MPRFDGLWRHRDFRYLWGGETVSVFGTLVGRLALAFTAILTLHASALEVSLLAACEMAPGVVLGVAAGVWVDRLPRRAVMIVADIARFLLLTSIPLAAAAGVLTIAQVFAVAALRASFDAFFAIAYQAYLPGLVGPESVIEGNSKLSASASVAEVAGFGLAGWLVQALSAPGAVLVDGLSFLVSAVALLRVRAVEAPVEADPDHVGFVAEARAGFAVVARDPVLRSLGIAGVVFQLSQGIFGAIIVLFVTRELDLDPGVQGMIYAIGGASSLVGALFAGRSARMHFGRSMSIAALLRGVGALSAALAAGPLAARVTGLAGNQLLTDPAATFYDIRETAARQTLVAPAILGRVSATFHMANFGAGLLGVVAAGLLADALGLRATMVLSAFCGIASGVVLFVSPVGRLAQVHAAVTD